jgi:hypothetical protein
MRLFIGKYLASGGEGGFWGGSKPHRKRETERTKGWKKMKVII